MNENPKIFLTLKIRPALHAIGLHSGNAEKLLLATAIQESHLTHRTQIRGPALSYFQIEPETHDDIWENFLEFRPTLANKVVSLLQDSNSSKLEELPTNDKYATAMARVHYLRVPSPIPSSIEAMAAYWKRYYNTPLGRGTESEFIANWKKYGKGVFE